MKRCPCCDREVADPRRSYCDAGCRSRAKWQRRKVRLDEQVKASFLRHWPKTGDVQVAAKLTKITPGRALRLAHSAVMSKELA